MDILIVIIAILCGVIGILGAILPVLPGPPMGLIGLFLIQWSAYGDFSPAFLIVFILLTLFVTLLDYLAPAWMTRKFGGSKAATNGSLIGMVTGMLFFPPFGIILGPFIGAFIGELAENRNGIHALKIASVSFVSFLLNTGLKLILSGVMLYYILISLF